MGNIEHEEENEDEWSVVRSPYSAAQVILIFIWRILSWIVR
jgi:hypothetical protein